MFCALKIFTDAEALLGDHCIKMRFGQRGGKWAREKRVMDGMHHAREHIGDAVRLSLSPSGDEHILQTSSSAQRTAARVARYAASAVSRPRGTRMVGARMHQGMRGCPVTTKRACASSVSPPPFFPDHLL